jgi:hypothetical protein
MNKLELKEIVGYLPYGLKMVSSANYVHELLGIDKLMDLTLLINGEERWNGENHIDYNVYYNDKIEFKPILFPISSLTQFREDLGFAPIEYIEELYYATNLGSQIERIIEDERWINHADFMIIQYFYEWKIDIHNLIDKGLAISVTEEFNPYK